MFRGEHPAMSVFLQWRDVEKEATTFGREWLNHVDPETCRVYPSWNQLRAESGRMSCSSPNMQQIPRGGCRKGIVAPPGYVFVRADFSQIEARVAAKISGDPVLTKLFMDGDDIHAYAAKKVLGKLSVTPEERQIGKSLVFGLLFSMSAPSLMVYCRTNYGVSMTMQEAEVYRNRFFQTFHGLAKWHDRMRHVCNQMNEFRTLIGRRRIVMNNNDNLNMLGLALNTPVQGTAADLLKIAVRECWERRDEFPEMNLAMLVHDEVVYECPERLADAGSTWLKKIMVDSGNIVLDPIPCDATVKVGATWGG
jgi:DNA polymerase-1